MTEPDATAVPGAGAPSAARAPSAAPGPELSAEEQAALAPILTAEYGLLMAALGAAWSASLARTSIFLVVLSAAGVVLGLAAQSGAETFRTLALVVLPVVLFLGVATFIRLVQVQRESIVYITGQNRIRHHFAQSVPASRPFFVLPIHDDQLSLFRSPGTGMALRPPRFRLLYLIVQTQGVVGLVAAAVAAAVAGLAAVPFGIGTGWAIAALAFLATAIGLFTYWQRSLEELWASIEPLYPTPPEDVGRPF